MAKKGKLPPMMQQYMQIKEENKDCILFYRLGDFYEMFLDDALTASKELEITLTGKNCGLEERAPMCGVPYHAVDSYLNKLVENLQVFQSVPLPAPDYHSELARNKRFPSHHSRS